MRESNYTYPPQNRATLSITHLLYDRRALDTSSHLAILNNLTSLTYLTQTSPRIREILTLDGGLERLLDILRESCFPRDYPLIPDLWGLNGPTTARVINFDRQMQLRHSLAFQCVVNIGVRGTEAIRTRVVQAGALDLVAQILETWLKEKGISMFAGPLGSQAAVDARAAGLPIPGVEERRRAARARMNPAEVTARPNAISQFVTNLTGLRPTARLHPDSEEPDGPPGDTDVDMADGEGETTDGGSTGGADDSMDVDGGQEDDLQAGPSLTPRARQTLLPMPVSIPARTIYSERREPISAVSSAGTSLTGDDSVSIHRATSENNLSATAAQAPRPPPLNLTAARIPPLAQDTISNQSSPMGTPTRSEDVEPARLRARRGTIIARPVNLAVRTDRTRDLEAGSGTSDGGEEVDLPAAIVAAGIAAANAQAMEGGGTVVPDEPGPPPNVEIVDGEEAGMLTEEPDADAMAAEQARLDMEAGAPPGQPGAAQTPRAPPADAPLDPAAAVAQQQTQIIIANGAPRGFHDLGSYVGISSLLNPDNDQYSNDSILLALQLLAYLSKYPHVRTAFHHPRRPMHPTFDLGVDNSVLPLPERPSVSETPNVFSLVERFTFRPSQADPLLPEIPKDIQYWAGVIMRNACRKDEARGGIRQCANMMCGRWEEYPREFAKCRRCRKAKYCNKVCQSRAWSDGHRFWCNSRSEDGPGEGEAGPSGRSHGPEEEDEFETGEIPADLLARIRAAHLMGGNNGQDLLVLDRGQAGGAIGLGAGTTNERGRAATTHRAPPNPIAFGEELHQMALLQESLLGNRARPARTEVREETARSRTADGTQRAGMLFGVGMDAEPRAASRGSGPVAGSTNRPRSPVDLSHHVQTPSAPRLSHRQPRPEASLGINPQTTTRSAAMPHGFSSEIVSPTPREGGAGPSRLVPGFGRSWLEGLNPQGGLGSQADQRRS